MNGSEFGRGDAVVLPHLSVSQGLGYPLSDLHPRLLAWEQRIASRSSVKRVVNEAAGFLRELDGRGGAPGGGDAPIVRQYRDHRLEWMMKTGGASIVADGVAAGTIRFAEEYE
jgi:glutathione S-transferase/RNA polymerase-associated protein